MDPKKIQSSFSPAIEHFSHEIQKIRDNRPSPELLEDIQVEVYGAKMPIKQLGTVSVVDPTLMSIQVWDASNVESIKKALNESALNLNASSDGQLIRIPLPPMSEERREELVKFVKKIAEEAKISIRNIRRDLIDSLKESALSEDDVSRGEKEIQKITDEKTNYIDEELEKKEKDLMTI